MRMPGDPEHTIGTVGLYSVVLRNGFGHLQDTLVSARIDIGSDGVLALDALELRAIASLLHVAADELEKRAPAKPRPRVPPYFSK
jgi:hypothetical protein